MTEGIIIDGIKYFKQRDINKGLNEEHYVTEFHLLAKHYNLLLEDYARKYNSLKEQLKRKEQECEELKREIAFGNNGKLSDKIRAIVFKNLNDENSKYKQALDEIEKELIPICESCRKYYTNQHCENCDTGAIKDLINKAKGHKTMNNYEPNQKEKKFIYGESKGCTAIYAVDKPSPNNNSYHEFIINYEPDSVTSELLGKIKLQNGNFAEFGHNGIFTEHLLIIARDCLERFNTSKYACKENTLAINNINNALMWLNKRTTERVKRGVYGTETV